MKWNSLLATAVLVVAAIAGVFSLRGSAQTRNEYVAVSVGLHYDDKSLTAVLNKYSADGWELSGVTEAIPVGSSSSRTPVLIPRRAAR